MDCALQEPLNPGDTITSDFNVEVRSTSNQAPSDTNVDRLNQLERLNQGADAQLFEDLSIAAITIKISKHPAFSPCPFLVRSVRCLLAGLAQLPACFL